MEKKFIKIEWDEKGISLSRSDGLLNHEIFGILEAVKLILWEHKEKKK